MTSIQPVQTSLTEPKHKVRIIHAPFRNNYTDNVLQEVADAMRVIIVNRTPNGEKVFKPRTQ